jgi:uncharacterized protein
MQAFKCTSLVIKVASRCNLNCSYCYMYNMGDKSYLSQPKFMSDRLTDKLIDRVNEHCLENKVDEFLFAFHGGEPLLAGQEYFSRFVEQVKERLSQDIKPHFAIQTNGLLLNTSWSRLFASLDIQLGLSLDGTEQVNDRFRLDHKGRGSYHKVIKGLDSALREPYHARSLGILSVVNAEADPEETYRHFRDLGVPHLDFLLPYNNYDKLPPGFSNTLDDQTLYGNWLIRVFDSWFDDESKMKPAIRMFTGIIESLLGGEFPNDLLGNFSNQLLVIETDGAIEAVDYLKSCGNGFTKAGANILTHALSEAMDFKLANLYINSHTKLHKQCLSCPVQEVCGGGHLTSRYSSLNGFNNPSVYCHDLLKLITHIQNRVFSGFPSEILQSAGASILSYENALERIRTGMPDISEPVYAGELEDF